MPKNDYVHAIYVIGIILILAPAVQGLLFYIFQLDKSPTYASMVAGQFYAVALLETAGLIMIIYVAYKRFMEGWRSVKIDRNLQG
jgi:hypothetical protein